MHLLSAASNWRYPDPTIHYHATTIFVELTITVSMLTQSLHTLDSRAQPVATDRALPLKPMELNLPLAIGMAHTIALQVAYIILILSIGVNVDAGKLFYMPRTLETETVCRPAPLMKSLYSTFVCKNIKSNQPACKQE